MRKRIRAGVCGLAVASLCGPAWGHGNGALSGDDFLDLSLEQLLQVEVLAPGKTQQQRWQTAAVTQVISRQEIARFGGNSLYEVLERATSVWMTGSHFYPQNVASLRGDLLTHSNNHVLLLLDGRPLRDSFTGGEAFGIFNALPLAALERIEIVRGPGSVLYGANAYTGVINLVTRVRDEAGISLKAGVGELGTRQAGAHGQWRMGQWQADFALHGMREDGWDFRAVDAAGVASGIDYGERNLGAVLRLGDGDWRVEGVYLRSRQDFFGAVASWSGTVPPDARDVLSERWHFNLGRRLAWGDDKRWEFDVTGSQVDFDHYNYATRSRDWQGELTFHQQIGPRWRWLAGAAFWHQDIESFARINPAPISSGQRMLWHGYAEAHYQGPGRFSMLAGVQWNKVEDLAADSVPRIGLFWELPAGWRLRLLHGEAYRAPNGIETRFLTIVRNSGGDIIGGLRGNPLLQPERVASTDLGLSWQGERGELQLTGFRSRQRDLITRQRAADRVIDFVNAGELTLRGVELEARYEPHPAWLLSAAMTWQRGESDSGIDDFTLVPRRLGKLGIAYRFGERLSLGLFDVYASEAGDVVVRNPARLPRNPAAAAYHQLSLQLNVTTSEWLPLGQASRAKLYAYNLLDAEVYQPEFVGLAINTIPARAGRSLYLAFEVDF
ncbi:MAG TPA: TonB-dependent receptor [Arenimonas sp.]|nr:TonB-dependent receptor [Arenimonas sp.]